jgi:hypothetical protein
MVVPVENGAGLSTDIPGLPDDPLKIAWPL